MLNDEGGSGGSVFSGIDPDALKGTIDSVRRDQETLQDRASYFKMELAYYGVGAEEFKDVLHVASWARDELPMLKRRYHLAMNMDNDPYPGFQGHGPSQRGEGHSSCQRSGVQGRQARREAREEGPRGPQP
ncbi:hypothetical protein GCM10010307_42440 [Streptomyces vastus]|uniref:Uncharacterized protein n=1 Tax=Streptomyces vastus TaxID=285451 RepID=A0ABN3R1X2_9ACTN